MWKRFGRRKDMIETDPRSQKRDLGYLADSNIEGSSRRQSSSVSLALFSCLPTLCASGRDTWRSTVRMPPE
jgi:hypothetical protein